MMKRKQQDPAQQEIPMATSKIRFELGKTVATPAALDVIPQDVIAKCLVCHVEGDWGKMQGEDAEENEYAVELGERILSVYDHGEIEFWICTEADRSVTTILLPTDY